MDQSRISIQRTEGILVYGLVSKYLIHALDLKDTEIAFLFMFAESFTIEFTTTTSTVLRTPNRSDVKHSGTL